VLALEVLVVASVWQLEVATLELVERFPSQLDHL
jgi:hypothetical protein